MWEFFQYLMGFVCILFGVGGGGAAIVYSQDGARTSEFGFAIMLVGVGWGASMAYIAYRLFGFN